MTWNRACATLFVKVLRNGTASVLRDIVLCSPELSGNGTAPTPMFGLGGSPPLCPLCSWTKTHPRDKQTYIYIFFVRNAPWKLAAHSLGTRILKVIQLVSRETSKEVWSKPSEFWDPQSAGTWNGPLTTTPSGRSTTRISVLLSHHPVSFFRTGTDYNTSIGLQRESLASACLLSRACTPPRVREQHKKSVQTLHTLDTTFSISFPLLGAREHCAPKPTNHQTQEQPHPACRLHEEHLTSQTASPPFALYFAP